MIQATGDVGTQWILDLCNGIVKEGGKEALFWLCGFRKSFDRVPIKAIRWAMLSWELKIG